ncbi:uncharacterized protein BDZ83DRAFT_258260 [Colletotrichum acutatum]|uniref:Uncharacterized protein n=1 Tax=Glomerella acutata TaxID=27357 RepID=A0AAD8XHF7_GLOAC|nr:uncharacterized protein BDZ83DRAFT_258260 [Colletotrichum acutatum]KAK1726421.1 hypothetical protein BDZ83DRAFT_258260 [Colletotrichum acutatum]
MAAMTAQVHRPIRDADGEGGSVGGQRQDTGMVHALSLRLPRRQARSREETRENKSLLHTSTARSMWVAGRGGAYCTRYSSTRDVQTMYACHSDGRSEARQPALTTNQSIIELRGRIWGRTTAIRTPAAGTPAACIDFGEKTNHLLPSPRALPQSPGSYQCKRVARQAEDRSLDASPRGRRSFSNSRKFTVLPNTQRCGHGFRTGKSCSQGGDSIPPMPKCGRLLKSGVSGFFASSSVHHGEDRSF